MITFNKHKFSIISNVIKNTKEININALFIFIVSIMFLTFVSKSSDCQFNEIKIIIHDLLEFIAAEH